MAVENGGVQLAEACMPLVGRIVDEDGRRPAEGFFHGVQNRYRRCRIGQICFHVRGPRPDCRKLADELVRPSRSGSVALLFVKSTPMREKHVHARCSQCPANGRADSFRPAGARDERDIQGLFHFILPLMNPSCLIYQPPLRLARATFSIPKMPRCLTSLPPSAA